MRLLTFGMLLLGTYLPSAVAKPTRAEIVAYHKECREQFRDIDLIAKFGADYRDLDLSEIDLRGEGRNGVHIHTNLRGADLSGANLREAILTGVILEGANLKGIKAKGAYLGQVVADQANLDGADLRDSHVDFMRLRAGSARGADFSGAEISAAQFDGADLTGAAFQRGRCQWYPPYFADATLTDVDFAGATLLPGADFRGARLLRTNLRGIDLTRADFRGANLEKAVLADTIIRYAQFDDAHGISDEDRADLLARSERWKYEVKLTWDSVVEVSYRSAYFLSPLLAITAGLWMRFRSDERIQRHLGWIVIAVNVIGLLALGSLLVFSLFGSQVAQFNAGNDARMSAWSFWLRFWPVLMSTLGLAFCAAAALTLVSVAGLFIEWRRWRIAFAGCALSTLHIALEFQFVGRFFPTA